MKTLYSLMLALPLLAGSGMALADHDHGHDRGHDRHDWQDRHEHRYHDDRRYVVVSQREHYRHWERGHRYGGPIYVVQDYGRYRLRPPPYGYGWVRAENNDYLLVALATGIILDVAMH